jgi:hypothetical protein
VVEPRAEALALCASVTVRERRSERVALLVMMDGDNVGVSARLKVLDEALAAGRSRRGSSAASPDARSEHRPKRRSARRLPRTSSRLLTDW